MDVPQEQDVATLRRLVADLLERQARMETDQRRLESEVEDLRSAPSNATAVQQSGHRRDDVSDEHVIEVESAVTRRGWMKAAAAAAVGGTAVALSGAERAAASPSALFLGTTNANADRTLAQHTGAGAGQSFLFEAGGTYSGAISAYPSALGGWTASSGRPTGVYGFTNVNSSKAFGVVGVAAQPSGVGVLATNSAPSGIALRAEGSTGVQAKGTSYGARVDGDTAALYLNGADAASPLERSDYHFSGELEGSNSPQGLFFDSLWFCVTEGTPGSWRKLAGPDSSGVLHAITPARVYDSRRPAPSPGSISAGGSRVVSVKDGRDEATGAVIAAGVVPEHARAVAYNVTLDQTVSAGFLAVVPGDVTASAASSINWSASGLILANAGIVKLDGSRQVNVLCGGAGSTHFIIDITGYYL